jgi:MFS family permease
MMRSFSQALLVIVVPLYVAAAGHSGLRVGYLLSVTLAGSTLMTVLAGVLSDRFGRKPLLIAIAVLAALGSAGFALTTRFGLLCVMAALASVRGGGAGSGGGFGPFYPAEQALIASSSPDRYRNTVFSALSVVGVLAGAVGSAAAFLPGLLRTRYHLPPLEAFRPILWLASATSLGVILFILPLREPHRPRAGRPGGARPRLTTRTLIARLWVTNAINGLVIGVIGPFLTYWFAARYGQGSTEIAALYLAANLLTALSYLAAPPLARRLGTVPAIVLSRSGSVLFMALMAVAPTFVLAGLAYTLRIMVNSVSMPLRQSYVMGIADERSRSRVAALGGLPSQAAAMPAPALASHLMTGVSQAAPVWMAAAAQALNAVLFDVFFRRVVPPDGR